MADQQPLGDNPPSDAKPKKSMTNYMVIWAPVPEEDDERKWREIGFYKAHSQEAAKTAARDDKESGHHSQLRDVAASRGFQIRAIAESSWPEDDEVHTMEQPPPDWGVKKLKGGS